jgi:hypothetical protein
MKKFNLVNCYGLLGKKSAYPIFDLARIHFKPLILLMIQDVRHGFDEPCGILHTGLFPAMGKHEAAQTQGKSGRPSRPMGFCGVGRGTVGSSHGTSGLEKWPQESRQRCKWKRVNSRASGNGMLHQGRAH